MREIMVRPLLASLLCAGSAAAVYGLLIGPMGAKIAALAAILAAVAVYVLAVLLLRCLSREDLMLLPFGGKLCPLLEKLHLLK